MNNDNTTVATPELEISEKKITAEIVKANFQLELSKLKYHEALQNLVAFQVTRENVVPAQEKLKEARKMLTKFDEIKKKGKEEALAICRWWDDAYNGTKESFESELGVKQKEVTKIANQLAEEAQRAETERQRKAGILSEIDTFFINQSQAIAAATEPSELVRIEKLLGSNKANVSRYQEFLPQMAEKAQILAELIKTQKDAIKKIADLRAKEAVAEKAGDDQAVLDLREAQETVTAGIEQTRIDVQETTIKMASQPDVVEPEIIVPVAPKARRSVWTWTIIDPKQVMKKMPDWVDMTINTQKVDDYLKAKKAEGIEGEEFEFAGIKFWLEKSY